MNQIGQLFNKRYQLFVLALGVLIAVLASAQRISVGERGSIDFAPDHSKALWILAFCLIALSFFLLIKESFRDSGKAANQNGKRKFSENHKAFVEQKRKLENFTKALDDVIKRVEGSEDAISKSLCQALKQIDSNFSSHQDRAKVARSVIEWIESNESVWLKEITRQNYQGIRRTDFRSFKENISILINKTLRTSIDKGAFVLPENSGINRKCIGKLAPYKKALIEIRKLMEQSLDSTSIDLFGPEERYMLSVYMEGLINRF